MFLETHSKEEIWEEVTQVCLSFKVILIQYYSVALLGLSIMICKMRGP